MGKHRKRGVLSRGLRALMVEFRLPTSLVLKLRPEPNPLNPLTKFYNICYYGYPYMFNAIEIDTYNVCNRKCSYCPNSLYQTASHKMEDNLFHKIIDELGKIKYNGIIRLERYGEPLLDDRLDKFVEYIKTKSPLSWVHIYTNGDFLDYKRFKELINKGVDHFNITQHSNCLSEANLSLFKNATLEDRCHFSFIMGAQIYLFNRGGIFESSREPYFQDKSRPCYFPFNSFIVDSYGKVILCCQDYHSSVVSGDLNKQSIMEIWKSKKFDEIRKELARGNRNILETCKKCDA